MESRRITELFFIIAIIFPMSTVCQSRGEFLRRPLSIAEPLVSGVRPYYNNARQYQSQSQYPSSNPDLYNRSPVQTYNTPTVNRNPLPEYYNSPNNQQAVNTQYQQPLFIQTPQYTPQHAPQRPAVQLPFRPPPPPYVNNQNNPLANRFGEDENNSPSFANPTTRFPPSRSPVKGPKKPSTTAKVPIFTDTRFMDRDSVSKKLFFDGELSNSMEEFALSLMSHFHVQLPTTNFMISPFSIYHLLVLISEGARGKTFEQMSDALNLRNVTRTRDFQQYLTVALNQNTADVTLQKFALLITDINRPISKEYDATIEKIYDAEVLAVDFREVDKTMKIINDQVSNYTHGLIRETVKRDDLFKAQLIILSGLFFQGRWMNVFNTTFTKREPFFDTNGNEIGAVNMMFQRGPIGYSAIADLGCHVVELPYAQKPQNRNDGTGTNMSMVLVLPRKGLSLDEAIGNVYRYSMTNIYRELHNSRVDYEDDEVEVHVPRFEIETNLDMKQTLQGLGIYDVFEQGQADLSGINKNYFVSSMIHKTKISVDEQGTTAAAVSTSIFANKATPPKFHANKPFAFFIVDRLTKLILFSGQYVQPLLF